MKFSYEHSLLNTKIEVQEQTFESVSRDIHDGIGQVLSLGCMQLANLKNSIDNPVVLAKLDETLQIFKKSVKDLRLLSHSLNTGMIEHRSLEQSIRIELDRIETFSDIVCSVIVEDETVISPQQCLIVFRIIQEALQNVMKHAEASRIDIIISQNDPFVHVRIRDNGIGFDKQSHEEVTSLGLLSMQQRATLLEAQLTIKSSPGKGTEILLVMPIKNPL